MKFTRSPAMASLVLGGLFLFIDTLLSWQAVTVGRLTYSRNAWHGFWGVILGLMSIAFLLSASVQGGIVELKFRLPHRLLAIVLAPVMLVVRDHQDDQRRELRVGELPRHPPRRRSRRRRLARMEREDQGARRRCAGAARAPPTLPS